MEPKTDKTGSLLTSVMAVDRVVYTSVREKERNEGDPINRPPKGFGVRHTQALILFISLSIGYSMRAHLSISVVAMTSPNMFNSKNSSYHETDKNFTEENISMHNLTVVYEHENITKGNGVYVINKDLQENSSSWSIYRTYTWKKPTQEMILFSFFVGYTSMMLPMGLIAQKFGGKTPILIALGANGVLSIITPWLPIFGGWLAVCACRLLQGMTQAAFYPSIHTLLGKWAPLSERGRLSTYIYTGSQFGTILAFQISGLFAGSPALGWPSTFWLCGIASLICFVLLAWFGAATPNEHPTISSDELAYIMGDGSANIVTKKRKTPWKHILTSKAVWALISAHVGSAVWYLFVLTQIPLYMNKILSVDIKRNGLYSSLPYIAMYFMMLLFGFLSDYFANKGFMSIANIRRTANSIGMVLSPLFLLAFCYVNSTAVAILLLILSVGLHSGVHVGFHINQIDLAPNFAGPIMALGNMTANLCGLMIPVLVSNIVKNDVTNQSKWQIVFIIVTLIQIVTNTVFLIFVRGTVQAWNFYGEDKFESNDEGMCAAEEKETIIIKNNEHDKLT